MVGTKQINSHPMPFQQVHPCQHQLHFVVVLKVQSMHYYYFLGLQYLFLFGFVNIHPCLCYPFFRVYFLFFFYLYAIFPIILLFQTIYLSIRGIGLLIFVSFHRILLLSHCIRSFFLLFLFVFFVIFCAL